MEQQKKEKKIKISRAIWLNTASRADWVPRFWLTENSGERYIYIRIDIGPCDYTYSAADVHNEGCFAAPFVCENERVILAWVMRGPQDG